jgi:hypothetical protein
MHGRAGGHRGLPTGGGAFVGEGFGLQQSSPTPAATQAHNPAGQRRAKSYSANALSIAKLPWNSINDRGNHPSDPETWHSPCLFDPDAQLTPTFLLWTAGASCIRHLCDYRPLWHDGCGKRSIAAQYMD